MINLLPSQYKEKLLLEETRRLVIILGVLVFLSLFSLILILLSIKIYLSGQVQNLQTFLEFEREEFEVQEIKDLQDRVKISNKKLSQLDALYSQKINLADIFNKTIKTIPPGIYLTNLSYPRETSQIILSGFSPSRDILFQFKKNLEKDFQNVYFPPESWVKSTDIDFSGISFKISE